MAVFPEFTPREKNEEREARLYSSIFQVAARITEICVNGQKEPDEVVDVYCKVYDRLLERWFKAVPIKEDLKHMLEMFFPDYYGPYPDDSPYKKKFEGF